MLVYSHDPVHSHLPSLSTILGNILSGIFGSGAFWLLVFLLVIVGGIVIFVRFKEREKLAQLPTPVIRTLLSNIAALDSAWLLLHWLHREEKTRSDGSVYYVTHRPVVVFHGPTPTGYTVVLRLPAAIPLEAYKHSSFEISNALGEPVEVEYTAPREVTLTFSQQNPLLRQVKFQ